MTGCLVRNDEFESVIGEAAIQMKSQGMTDRWIADRRRSLLASRRLTPRCRSWGWKEPISHMYIDALHSHFHDQLRYVHVIRNGLDMAFSPNQRQAIGWSRVFGLNSEFDDAGRLTPSCALDYWIAANKRAIDLGGRLEDRFLLLNFDEFCRQPRPSIAQLLGFLHVDVDSELFASLIAIPQVPASAGRYRKEGVGCFSAQQLADVAALGFAVEA
jgi:hypothetical protein